MIDVSPWLYARVAVLKFNRGGTSFPVHTYRMMGFLVWELPVGDLRQKFVCVFFIIKKIKLNKD